MADNNFRSYRRRNPTARDELDPTGRDAGSDPLAELARLIGQSDPNADYDRDARHPPAETFDDTAPAGGLDWAADDGYAEQDRYTEQDRYSEQDRATDRYAPPPLSASYPSYSSKPAYSPPEADYADEPQAGGREPALPARFNGGCREEAQEYAAASDDRYPDEPAPPVPRGGQAPLYAAQAPHDDYGSDEQEHDGAADDGYAPDDYYDEAPPRRRRSGIIVVVAVLGLAVLGTAGAFAYRAMFGGSVLPSLPPIIKAGDGPNKIVPPNGDSQTSNSKQAAAAGSGSGEKLVSREEQPVNMPDSATPPNSAPSTRVVSTIPVPPGSSLPLPGSPSAPPALAAPSPGSPSMQPAAAPAVVPLPEAKKIHTVTIRPDQPGADAGAAPAAPPPRNATRSAAPPRPAAAPAGSSAPLALVPASGEAPAPLPARTHTAAAHPAPVSPAAEGEPAPAAGGGYAVQVTSQHSEADAMAAYRSLQAKYPKQLGGRQPIVRRADLGAKGVFYRALVGPFASMEQASGICSGIKSAGGSCIVQKN
jgi:SPOR domain